MNEPFDIKKTGKSFVEWLPWWKSLMIGTKIVIIFLVGLTIYRAYFRNINKQEVTIGKVEKGGKVIIERPKEDRRVGLQFFVTSKDAGAVFFKDIGNSWRAGIGAEYDFDHKEVMPRAGLEWLW